MTRSAGVRTVRGTFRSNPGTRSEWGHALGRIRRKLAVRERPASDQAHIQKSDSDRAETVDTGRLEYAQEAWDTSRITYSGSLFGSISSLNSAPCVCRFTVRRAPICLANVLTRRTPNPFVLSTSKKGRPTPSSRIVRQGHVLSCRSRETNTQHEARSGYACLAALATSSVTISARPTARSTLSDNATWDSKHYFAIGRNRHQIPTDVRQIFGHFTDFDLRAPINSFVGASDSDNSARRTETLFVLQLIENHWLACAQSETGCQVLQAYGGPFGARHSHRSRLDGGSRSTGHNR